MGPDSGGGGRGMLSMKEEGKVREDDGQDWVGGWGEGGFWM